MQNKIATLFFTSLVMTGCATQGTEQRKSLQIQSVQDDRFSKEVTIVGPELYENPFGGIFRGWAIRSWIDKKTLTVTDQLYVEISYLGDWKFFKFAADDTANDLKVTKISSRVGDCFGGCDLHEIIGIDLDNAILRSHMISGYQIKVTAQSGDALIITISPEQIRLQLDAISRHSHTK